jgi:phosphoglycolate phosphatase-like HAD superfamily hydrolase/predicted TIM-barrel fold metal-dependent hydrolase
MTTSMSIECGESVGAWCNAVGLRVCHNAAVSNPFDGASAVLFDLDGTLMDTHIDFPAMRAAMVRLAGDYGFEPDALEGLDILAIVSFCADRLTQAGQSHQAEAFRAAARGLLRSIEIEQCSTPVEVPGARELLQNLHEAGMAIGIVTRNCREVSEELLAKGRLTHDALISRDDVEKTKPAPEHIHAALAALNHNGDRGAAVMVGDHWMDVLAGARAGCRTVGLLRGRDASWFSRAVPDTMVDGVADLVPLFAQARSAITRRTLMGMAGGALLAGAPTIGDRAATPSAHPPANREWNAMKLDAVPSYATHEHWSSLSSFGMAPEGFRADVLRGALPQRRSGLFDVLFDPYFGGWLAGAGVDIGRLAREAGVPDLFRTSPADLVRCWHALKPALSAFAMTGAYRALRTGLLALYGVDIENGSDAAIQQLDRQIGENYAGLYQWYETAMRRARLLRPIRPVHPEFFWRSDEHGDPEGETRVFRPILRVDPLLSLWEERSERRDGLAALTGVEPDGAASWRRFLQTLFERAASQGCVGIKQLQAYRRDLNFEPVADTAVVFRGALDTVQQRAFENWVMHECCKLANDHDWPHQIHTGTHNLPHSSPLPLAGMAQRYRRMPMVLLHCWPYLTESGWLAWQHPNVYLDGCWMPIINPAYLREALVRWLGLVPVTKVMCGHDSTSIEMAVGSVALVRSAIGEALDHAMREGVLSGRSAEGAAEDLLHRNAERLYETALRQAQRPAPESEHGSTGPS